MKFLHISDLHIGKRVNEFSLLEDQKYVLSQILSIALQQQADGILLAGDVYDKPIPSAEAVQVFDDFLTRLAEQNLPVFLIHGNHDSAERLAFGARLLQSRAVYISPVYRGKIEPFILQDEFGELNIYLLPFIKPAYVKALYPDKKIETYNDAVRAVIEEMEPNPDKRNVLVAHQFVTGAEQCDSEDISVGGVDNVDAALFDAFDYVALGHLHRPQNVRRETVRYCGTPLKYSFSEASDVKSVTLAEIGNKGEVSVSALPLRALHDMREIRGTYMELANRNFYNGTATDDYLHVILTDEEDIPDAIGKLRAIYPNIMRLEYDNLRTRSSQKIILSEKAENKTPMELFEEFYQLQNNSQMTQEQKSFSRRLAENIWEGGGQA